MSSFTFDVFISYSHLDTPWVRDWLLPRLEQAGLRVCIDFRDFSIGKSSLVNMENAVEQSRKTLLIMTPSWIQSEWTNFESLLIQTEDPSGVRQRTLPLLLEKCQLPRRLGILTHADFTDKANWNDQLKRVIAAIRESPISQPPAHSITPLTPKLVHTYPLEDNFTGRKSERQELSAWLTDNRQPIFALIAMGGMGKSALSWYWIQNDVLPSATSAVEGAMWLSFYESESSFAKFIDEALKYVTGQSIDAARFPTTYDRAQELRQQLQTKRVLFVLDGFERQLRSYARLDAAYQQDAAADSSREARSCVEPDASRWLKDIASGATRAKVLITTRLMVSDLEDRAGDALAGVHKRELNKLPREDAVKFMRAQGVTNGTSSEIAAVCDAYGFHPLSLRLLSGLIKRDPRTSGDIAAAPRHDVHADLIQRQHHVLEQSYNALPDEERTLLSRVAAFRSPMNYDTLTIFDDFGSPAKFDAALDDLLSRGLLQRDILEGYSRYDLHPIVRHYAYDRLTDKTGIHTRLRDYFAKISVPDEDEIQGIEDLMPVIERYHHTVRSGQYDEALLLYYTRIWDALFYRFGAYRTEIELLLALFPDGADRPPRLQENVQGWPQNELANSYSISGQPRQAVPLFERQIALCEKIGDKKNLSRGLTNVSTQQLILGELAAAERNLRRSVELCREIEEGEFEEAVVHIEMGRLLAYLGVHDEATQELSTSMDMFINLGYKLGIGLTWAYIAQHALFMGDTHTALEAAQRAYGFAIAAHNERDNIRTEWLLGMALLMEGKDLNAAAMNLADALTRCRRINMVDHEPDILLAWARWYRARGNVQEAEEYAEEALVIADRCDYRLKQAEIHYFLAQLALDAGDTKTARKEAEIAKERAWCDGPPFCYKPALDEAEGMLRELGGE